MSRTGYAFVECPHCGNTDTVTTYIQYPDGVQVVMGATCLGCHKHIPQTRR